MKYWIKYQVNLLKNNVIPRIKLIFEQDKENKTLYEERVELLKGLVEEISDADTVDKSEADTVDKSKNEIKLSFWDIYLLYLRKNKNTLTEESNWSDVEGQILNFYKKNNGEMAKYNELVGNSENNSDLKKIFENLTDKSVHTINVDEYLYEQLIQFSKNFVDYLKSIYNHSHLQELTRTDTINQIAYVNDSENSKYEILNFNYTPVCATNCVKEIHIHGSLNEQPIIGINSKDLTSNKEHAFKLTKQYQLISNENNKVEKLDLNNINRIIFYGHSLALADYQYFKNIFDRINLDESSVQLVFKYSENYEMYDSVFDLLDRYSEDIGVDVVTTLTLENRLKIEMLPH